ncbi:Helicase associated domain protein [Nonomuraea sp. NPDC046802]|uniref:Helicase associated domain protein n=1 Tax=Nonomuraea sp. NPDC046802 TaxID=3154919 RepID=UPI0033FFC2C7
MSDLLALDPGAVFPSRADRQPQPPTPRPHQQQALTALTHAFAEHDRAQLVMACGAGKTFVGRWTAELTQAHGTLVLVPSLALIAQTLREWRRVAAAPFRALIVCSDPSTAAGAEERGHDEFAPSNWSTLRTPVTTSAKHVANFLTRTDTEQPLVVFCTYHSLPVIEEAQRIAENRQREATFDLLVADEAHHLAGRPREAFRLALNPHAIRARKRLSMTATPYITSQEQVLSMSDRRLFGPVAHRLTFAEAIARRLLCDYQVVVLGERAAAHDHGEISAGQLPATVLAAVQQHGLRRLITFHGRVAKSSAFAEALDGRRTLNGRRVSARHLDSSMHSDERARTLAWLGHVGDDVRVVSNARCLAEGVDVPAIDAVVFASADPRSRSSGIIQAVGRVLRPAPGKQVGTIVIPVALPADGDDDSALMASSFAHVWTVVRALRAHDERLAQELDQARSWQARSGLGGKLSLSRINFVLPDGVDERTIHLRLVQEVGSRWAHFYGLLQNYTDEHHSCLLPWNGKWKGAPLGPWCEQQRAAHRAGRLPIERAQLLEQIPGWTWERADGYWQETFKNLAKLADERGSLHQDPAEPSIYTGWRTSQRHHLGPWVALQRQLYRDDMLGQERASQLAALPGWSWDAGLPADDVAMIQALRLFCEFEHHADVPEDHQEGDLPLGRWVWAIRRRKLTGRLHPTLAEEIVAATPRGRKGEPTFRWEVLETQWRLAYSALVAYTRREGHAVPPTSHVEKLPDGTIHLGQWASLQRHRYHRGRLDPRLQKWLQALSGWRWTVPLTRVEYGAPIDLGGHAHGTAKGIAAHCPCPQCLDARRAKDRDYLAQKRQMEDPVPAGPIARWLQTLEAAGAKRTAIAVTAGVPLGVVRTLLKGDCDEIERVHAEALHAVTVEGCRSRATRVGSRGRTTSADNERVAIGPTLALLEDLRSRGFGRMWVSRELGYAGGFQLHPTRISRRLANAIADLHARVGSLRSPVTGSNKHVPRLADLSCGAVPPQRNPRKRRQALPRRHDPVVRARFVDAGPATTERHCPRCRMTRTKADFYRNPSTHDGLSPWCKPCHNDVGFKPA